MPFPIFSFGIGKLRFPHSPLRKFTKIRLPGFFWCNRVLDKTDVELYGNCKLGESEASNDAMMSWDNSDDYWSLKEISDSTFLSVGKKCKIS